MTTFDQYARYYEQFSAHKDYAAEAARLAEVARRYAPGARTVLELGCGSGAHAAHLAREFELCGIDRSAGMIERARERKLPNARFALGDVRDLRLGESFDVILSLYHVVSYQTSNDDVGRMLATVKAHLAPGGVFLFDCWYGPGVLTDLPTNSLRRARGEGFEIVRFGTPHVDFNANTVEMRYEFMLRSDEQVGWRQFDESHRMRFFFTPELELLCGAHGLALTWGGDLFSESPLGRSTRYAWFAVRHAA